MERVVFCVEDIVTAVVHFGSMLQCLVAHGYRAIASVGPNLDNRARFEQGDQDLQLCVARRPSLDNGYRRCGCSTVGHSSLLIESRCCAAPKAQRPDRFVASASTQALWTTAHFPATSRAHE